MENTEQQPAPQPQAAAPAPEAATPAPAASLDDLTKYLAEFDRETAKPAAPQPTATESVPDAPAANALTPANPTQTLDQAIAALQNDTRGTDEMRQAVNQLAGVVQNIQMQQALDRDRADFEGVLAKAAKMLESQELPASDEQVRRWFMSEIALNPEMVSAFDRRHQDARQFARAERKAFERLAESIKHRPDPDVTAERNAIVAAVTKSGSYKAPPERAIDYGSLSDAEYRAELESWE